MRMAPQKINSEALMLHVVFCMAIIMMVTSGIYFYYRTIFNETNITPFVCAFFLACIYTGRWLCQAFYLRHKPFHFSMYTVLFLMAIVIIWPFLVSIFFNTPRDIIRFSINTLPFFIIGLAIGIFIKMIKASMQRQLQEANITAEQKQSELNLLQAQLSPHFLFNTLNNLYGISITKHELIPALILKLSDLLRYSVYDNKKLFIPLKTELEYIHNYISFEKLRISDRLILQTEIESVESADILIAPMVLIVFIENAFKHARNTLDQKIYVEVSLKISGNFILFLVKNSYSEVTHKNNIVQASSGLGLSNTIRRLNLLYEEDFELKQFTKENLYIAQLRLKIK